MNRSPFILFVGAAIAVLVTLSAIGWAAEEPSSVTEGRGKIAAAENAEAIALGSSITRGIDFNAMQLDGVNFARNGQDWFELNAVSHLILAKDKYPKLWLVVLMPPEQTRTNGSKGAKKRSYRRENTYRLLWSQNENGLIDNDWKTAFSGAVMPSLGYKDWSPLLRSRLGTFGSWLFPRSTGGKLEPEVTVSGFENFAADRVKDMAEFDQSVRYFDSNVPERAEAAIVQLAGVLSRKDAQIVVIVPPVHQTLSHELLSQMPERTDAFVRLTKRLESQSIPVFSYWDDPRFNRRIDFFDDSIHLNEKGAEEFSTILAYDLREQGIWRNQED